MGNPYPAAVTDANGETRVAGQIDFTDSGNQPSGFTPVSCVLARNGDVDIGPQAAYDVNWDALYDNLWDVNPLAAIPAGLGLTFAFDDSSSLVVPTVAGVWALSYFGERQVDTTWAGQFAIGGLGVNLPWVQAKNAGVNPQGVPFMAGGGTFTLPAATQITHQVVTVTAATTSPSKLTQAYLSIVRLA